MHIQLDEEIELLKMTIFVMSQFVVDQLKYTAVAFKESDNVLAKKIIENDALINRYEVKIDKICLKIFALKQPLAIDLRFVAACLKVNNDLERIGDFAKRIAVEIINLSKMQALENLNEISDMMELGQEMTDNSMGSLIKRDETLAEEVISLDKKMDKKYSELFQKITSLVRQDSSRFELALSYINIAKSLERVGDLATNIAEQAIYLECGEIVKHQDNN